MKQISLPLPALLLAIPMIAVFGFVSGVEWGGVDQDDDLVDDQPIEKDAKSSRKPTQRGQAEMQVLVDSRDYSEAESCRQEVGFLSAQLEAYEGVPQSWQEAELEYPVRQEELSALLGQAWSEEAEIIEVRCDEYPCVVVGKLATDERSCCRLLSEELPADLSETRRPTKVWSPENDKTHFFMAFASPDYWNSDIQLRTSWRLARVSEEYRSSP